MPSILPGKVSEVRINRAGDNFSSEFTEFLNTVVECQNFCWADEGEGKRVKEEDQVFALEVGQLEFFQLAIDYSSAFEVRCRLRNQSLCPLKAVAGRLRFSRNSTT